MISAYFMDKDLMFISLMRNKDYENLKVHHHTQSAFMMYDVSTK